MPPTPAETWATALLHGWCVTFKFNFIYKTSRRTTRLMCFTSGAVYVKFPAPNTQTSIWNTTLKVFAEVIFKPNISERFLSQSSVVQFCLDGSCLCLASVKLLLCSASTLSLCFEELHSVFFSFHCFISGKLSDGLQGATQLLSRPRVQLLDHTYCHQLFTDGKHKTLTLKTPERILK